MRAATTFSHKALISEKFKKKEGAMRQPNLIAPSQKFIKRF